MSALHTMGLTEETLQDCAASAEGLRGLGQLLQPSEAACMLALEQACGPFVTAWMAQRHAGIAAAARQAHRWVLCLVLVWLSLALGNIAEVPSTC